METQLQKIATMIKKTFHDKSQEEVFDGCILYTEEQCKMNQSILQREIMSKLDKIIEDIKEIKTEIGINGKSIRQS